MPRMPSLGRTRRDALGAGVAACAVLLSMSDTARAASPSHEDAVLAAERAFAQTMAERDLAAFAGFLSDEAVFFSGGAVLRGKAAVVAGWAAYFAAGTPAPFSWSPDRVEVLASGGLAFSTGLVRDPQGRVAARFQSVWRREADGRWRVVFDKGSPPDPADRG